MLSNNSNQNDCPAIIYVMGIDGSGKSTVAEHLADKMSADGYSVEVMWLRFNHLFTKPLLGICRLLGYTKYEMVDGIRVGYHEFYRSKIISWLFVILQYLDAWRVTKTRIAPHLKDPNKVLILDRYIYDILIDIIIDTHLEDLDKTWMGRRFLNLMPTHTNVLPMLRNKDDLLSARPESAVDRNFDDRVALYEKIIKNNDLTPIINNMALEETLAQAESRIELEK